MLRLKSIEPNRHVYTVNDPEEGRIAVVFTDNHVADATITVRVEIEDRKSDEEIIAVARMLALKAMKLSASATESGLPEPGAPRE